MCGQGFNRKSHIITHQRKNTGVGEALCVWGVWVRFYRSARGSPQVPSGKCMHLRKLFEASGKATRKGRQNNPQNLHKERKNSPGQHGGTLKRGGVR